MADVFGFRSLIYWWGLLTASIFVKDWLKQLASLLEDPKMFGSSKFPFNLVPGINDLIDLIVKNIKAAVHFDPRQIVATIGPVPIQGWMLAAIIGVIFVVVGVRAYLRALKTDAWFDDLLTLAVLYLVLRLVGHTIGTSTLPFLDWFRAFVDNQGVTFIVMMVFLLSLSFVGEGLHSKRAFWRALAAAFLLALFIYPHEAATVLGYAVDGLAQLGAALVLPENLPFAVGWGVIGMVLALQRLTASEKVIPVGGGHSKREGKAEG